jgi:hypothetical protein
MIQFFLAICTTAVYKKDNGSCACGFYLQRGLYWRQAADRCYALGARLPEVTSARENEDLYSLMVNSNNLYLPLNCLEQRSSTWGTQAALRGYRNFKSYKNKPTKGKQKGFWGYAKGVNFGMGVRKGVQYCFGGTRVTKG